MSEPQPVVEVIHRGKPAKKPDGLTSREEQGFADKVTDPAVLARIAELMRSGPKP